MKADAPPEGQNYFWLTERFGGCNHFEWRIHYRTFLLHLDPKRPFSTRHAEPGLWIGPFPWENVKTPNGDQRARRLRVNEMLRLMSFPDDFKIYGSRADVQRQLGNAVPLGLGKAVVRTLTSKPGCLKHSGLDWEPPRMVV